MSTSVVVKLADAIAARLATLTWNGGAFTVTATYATVDELLEAPDTEDARIAVVVPDSIDAEELEARASVAREISVDVVLRRRFGTAEQNVAGEVAKSEIDALVELAETLGLAPIYARMDDMPEAAWIETEQERLFDREQLRQKRLFFSVTTLTFAVSTNL